MVEVDLDKVSSAGDKPAVLSFSVNGGEYFYFFSEAEVFTILNACHLALVKARDTCALVRSGKVL